MADRSRTSARSGRIAEGHPVDVASGEQFTAAHDVEVSGVSPLIVRRVYDTRFLDRPPSVLGVGWVHAFEATLAKDLDGFVSRVTIAIASSSMTSTSISSAVGREQICHAESVAHEPNPDSALTRESESIRYP
jgi:hypothetical protein